MTTPEIITQTTTLIQDGILITACIAIPRFKNIGRTISNLLSEEHPNSNYTTNYIHTIIDKENNRYISDIKYIINQ